LLLHGYGQLARDFLEQCAPLARPERRLVAPEALSRFYLRSGRGVIGASWMTREAREHEIDDYVAYLDALVDGATSSVAPNEVVVLGFSQGVATAWRWAARAQRAPQRLIAIAGGVPPDVDLAAGRLRKLRVTLAGGDLDDSHPPQAVEADEKRLNAAGIEATVRRFHAGHTMDASLLAQL